MKFVGKIAPIIAGTEGKPLFYKSEIQDYTLTETKLLPDSVGWLHYIKNDLEE